MTRDVHAFNAEVGVYDYGKYVYTVVYIPDEVASALPLEAFPRLRVGAAVNGAWLEGALMPDRVGSAQTRHLLEQGHASGQRVWYLLLPKGVLKRIGKTTGDAVRVELRVADQDFVEVPKALQDLLDGQPRLRAIWDALTPGKRRGLAHPVNTAKTPATRARRVEQLEIALLELGLPEA